MTNNYQSVVLRISVENKNDNVHEDFTDFLETVLVDEDIRIIDEYYDSIYQCGKDLEDEKEMHDSIKDTCHYVTQRVLKFTNIYDTYTKSLFTPNMFAVDKEEITLTEYDGNDLYLKENGFYYEIIQETTEGENDENIVTDCLYIKLQNVNFIPTRWCEDVLIKFKHLNIDLCAFQEIDDCNTHKTIYVNFCEIVNDRENKSIETYGLEYWVKQFYPPSDDVPCRIEIVIDEGEDDETFLSYVEIFYKYIGF